MFYAIPNISELGMVWMGDMMLHNDPSQELLMDPRQAESPFFASHHSFDDIRNHQIPPTSMVRYLAPQFHNECSEPEEPMEGVDVQDIQQDYDQTDGQEINEYLGLDDYMADEEREQMSTQATQTQDVRTRKIKPIKHPGLVLKTPIAYQPHTDLNCIPIRKDGIAVCQKCGAIGVKHAFYTRERRFCSRACARSNDVLLNSTSLADSTYSPTHSVEQNTPDASVPNDVKPKLNVKEEVVSPKEFAVKDKIKPVLSSKTQPVLPEELPVRRKMTASMVGSFDWTSQLKTPGFCAAPVSCFKHAPISEMWDNIAVGMKVEVENTDCDEVCEAFPDSFWVAFVLRISGYKALLRYEGFGNLGEKDFWVSLCSNEIHPVGWCATIGKPLIPPNTIANKYKDWKDFLTRRLTGARTLPTNFYSRVNDSMKSRFRVGIHLEVVDKNRISQVKVATVQKIVGKRLHVRYYDSPPDDNGFWCHEDSPLIHYVGWAKKVGQTLDAYPEYLQRIESGKLSEDDARPELFVMPNNYHARFKCTFSEGMKMEAIDPLNLSAICAATVMRVLREGYIMIRIDSYDEDINGADWFCYHSYSPCIFPVGFCATHGLPLTPPKGYDPTTFTWDSYLEKTHAIPAPPELFNREIPSHGFLEGMRLEAADLMDPRLVCVATITRVIGRLLRVHFDGWEDEYDQWLDCQSCDMYPVGWCDLVEHKLEGPRATGKNQGPANKYYVPKTPRGLKRRGRRKMKRTGGHRGPYTRSLQQQRLAEIRQAEQRQAELYELQNQQEQKQKPQKQQPQQQQKLLQQQQSQQQQQQHFQQQSQQQLVRIKEEHEIGPVQGTKIERERGDLESIPQQSNAREPEPALDAGPDQTLPSPTSGQGHSTNEPRHNVPSPPIPKERIATSYINVNSTSSKYIPRVADGIKKNSELGKLEPEEWNIFDVAQFLRVNDCAAYCDNFNKGKIDGKALLALTNDQIMDLTGFKVGPSLKIFDLVEQLRIKVNRDQERLKMGLKKLS